MPVDPLLRESVRLFVDESARLHEQVTTALLAAEEAEPGTPALRAAYEQIFRGLHTWKGTSATLGFSELVDVAHEMESIGAPLREGLVPPSKDAVDAILDACDAFLARVRAYAGGRDEHEPLPTKVLERLRSIKHGDAAVAQRAAASPSSGTAPEEHGTWRVNDADVQALAREVEELRELRLRLEDHAQQVRAIAGSTRLRALAPDTADALLSVGTALTFDAEASGAMVHSLEDQLRSICTLPMRSILEPLRRVVRDLCRASGKRAGLSFVGGDVAVDRRVLDALRAPLIHLVRNAVDHGVEPPVERKRNKKAEQATIGVRVEHQGNMLFVEVADDGAGLDDAAIRAAAVRNGLLDEARARALARPEVERLIFAAGLSTRAQANETSGRGVGLDVVMTQLRALGGTVDVSSVPGQGTRFWLHLPVELGSSALIVARVGEQELGVPAAFIEGVAQAPAGARASFEHRGRLVRLSDLGAVLGLREPQLEAGAPLLVCHAGGERVALAVDEVIGERDLVVRPLPQELAELPPYQGAAVTSRGDLLLVVKADWLVSQRAAPLPSARRALVVDDSLTARSLHRTMLEAGGYIVHTAASAADALARLAAGRYDVIVSDVAMATADDGFALLRTVRARADTRDVPLVLVTVSDDPALRRRAEQEGAAAFLTKPECAAGRLLGVVGAVLQRRLV